MAAAQPAPPAPQVPPVPVGLEPELLRTLSPSANLMAANEETFVRLLHEDIEPQVRVLPGGGWRFCERTARTVLWLAGAQQPPERAVEAMLWLAESNYYDGFPQHEYVSVGHALVRVVREMHDMSWTSAMGSAWVQLFMWMQPHLQAGAKAAAERAAADMVNSAAAGPAPANAEPAEARKRTGAGHEAPRGRGAALRETSRLEVLRHVPRRRRRGTGEMNLSELASQIDAADEDSHGRHGRILGLVTPGPAAARRPPAPRRPADDQ
jgi:hypothetical protein